MSSRNSHKKNMPHEYISTKESRHGYIFRLSNYFVLLSMILIQLRWAFVFPESVYLLVFSAIVGYDVPAILKILKEFVGKKK